MFFIRYFSMLIVLCISICSQSFATDSEFDYFNGCSRDTRKRIQLVLNLLERAGNSNLDYVCHDVKSSLGVQLAIELVSAKEEINSYIEDFKSTISIFWNYIETSASADDIREYLFEIDLMEKGIEDTKLSFEYIDSLEKKFCPWLSEIR